MKRAGAGVGAGVEISSTVNSFDTLVASALISVLILHSWIGICNFHALDI